MEHKNGCLICGEDIVYLQIIENGNCVYCNKNFNISERCVNGHYICDACHSSGALDIIEDYCLQTTITDPLEIANHLMRHPSVKMHGPEHHFLLPAVLLTVYYRITGNIPLLPKKLIKARKRAEMVPGGFCGTHGNCGAGVGSGIFISLITESTPLSEKEWQLSNKATAEALTSIATHGGPRCCKRDIYLSIIESVNFVEKEFKVKIPLNKKIYCGFSAWNKECLLTKCLFYKNNIMNNNELKNIVKEKYGEIANQSKTENETSCCGVGSTCCSGVDYTIFSENYTQLQGYNSEADLGLGCGIPTEFALIKKGDTVVDLGSGAGNDCFVARALVGESGKVIGIDFTETMIEKARENAEKLAFNNVEFRYGDIEKIPMTANKADVVISNCVLNLVPDKKKAFSEIYRILRQGGHFSISDVVLDGVLPQKIEQAAEMYASCVSGAIQKHEYLDIIKNCGFKNISVQKEKKIQIPDEIMLNYISENELEDFKNQNIGIFSITVYAEKALGGCGCACNC